MILWDEESISVLNKIVKFLKRSNLGRILEYLANLYIDEHYSILKLNQYGMSFSKGYIVDANLITDGEYKLAFICEIYQLKKLKDIDHTISEKTIYESLSEMIQYNLDLIFSINVGHPNYKEIYLTSLLKEVLYGMTKSYSVKQGVKIKVRKDKIIDQINYAYYMIREIIDVNNDLSVFHLGGLITETENLDLSILTNQQIRNILKILNTKRRIYLRILLILSYEIIKKNYSSEKDFIKSFVFKNYEDLCYCLNNSLNQTVLLISVYKIIKNEY